MRKQRILTVLFSTVLLMTFGIKAEGKDFYVKENLKRSDIVNMNICGQANLRASDYAPEIQAKLWKYKIKDTIGSEKLCKEEKALIKTFTKKINKQCFIKNSDARACLTNRLSELQDILITDYGWSEEKLYVYLETLLTVDELKRMVKSQDIKELDMLKY